MALQRGGLDFYDQPCEHAEDYLERWYQGAIRSRLAPIKRFARMIADHWEGVLFWHWTHVSNGPLEGTTPYIQAVKHRVRGYRTNQPHRMIYLIAGRLDLAPVG